jgi:hypothetical protein
MLFRSAPRCNLQRLVKSIFFVDLPSPVKNGLALHSKSGCSALHTRFTAPSFSLTDGVAIRIYIQAFKICPNSDLWRSGEIHCNLVSIVNGKKIGGYPFLKMKIVYALQEWGDMPTAENPRRTRFWQSA